MFLNCSKCFGRHTAHHQELKNCNCSLWFYIRFWLPAAAMAQHSSFFTRSVQRICFILLQYHTSKLSRYFCSIFRRKNWPLEEYLTFFSVSENLYNLVTIFRPFEMQCRVIWWVHTHHLSGITFAHQTTINRV